MEVTTTKILIIFGLLFTTLLAALIPLLCLKCSLRSKKKQKRKNASDGEKSLFQKLCSCCFQRAPLHQDKKMSMDTGSIRTTASQFRRVKLRSKMIMSMLNCFAGGIFLGTSFIGLLPEIRESFSNFSINWPVLVNSSSGETREPEPMPIAEIIVVCGLFLILSIEQAAHSINHLRQKRKKEARHQVVKVEMNAMNGALVESGEISSTDLRDSPTVSRESVAPKPDHDHSGIRSLMLVATLSIHSLLEGIAIGLQDSVGSIIAIFVAVLFHKSLMAFSMGTNLVRTKQSVRKIIAAACIFAFMSPVGIAIGIGVKLGGGGSNPETLLVTAVLQAIATGTFLYITFFEVLVQEFEAHGHRFSKLLSLFVGYGAVLGAFFAQHG